MKGVALVFLVCLGCALSVAGKTAPPPPPAKKAPPPPPQKMKEFCDNVPFARAETCYKVCCFLF